jgi:hypothetical protein
MKCSIVVEHHEEVPFRLLKFWGNLSVGNLQVKKVLAQSDNLKSAFHYREHVLTIQRHQGQSPCSSTKHYFECGDGY